MINAQTRIALAFTAGVCVGGGVGYLIASHHIKKLAAADLEAVQDMFRRVRAEDSKVEEPANETSTLDQEEDRYQTPAQSIAYEEEVVGLGYITQDRQQRTVKLDPNYVSPDTIPNDLDVEELEYETEPDHEEEVEHVRNQYEGDPDDVTTWDRSPEFPYVITEAEFRLEKQGEYEKDSLIYYAGDDTLAEEDGNFIPDKHGTAGNQNLRDCFGMGSGNPRLLYIRNDRVMADFEISLNDGKYNKEVLGFDDDVPPRPRNIKRR
jgi:hypothetical protein